MSLLALDRALFVFFNQTIANPVLDWSMPFFAWNKLFAPALIVTAIVLLWKGGVKGWIFLSLLVVTISLTDGLVCSSLKEAVDRSRPFVEMTDARLLVGRGGSGSFPSSHAANWFAAATLIWIYYRRAFPLICGVACVVAFSRVYVGVHYPSDVLGGALIGMLVALGGLWVLEAVWRTAGRAWFPLWWAKTPSLLPPRQGSEQHEDLYLTGNVTHYEATKARQWERLAYLAIGVLLLTRWAYLGSGKIELSEDEAYQWLWSMHLDLSYFSKPPLIAYAQFLGASLWGNTEFGVRFLSPLLAAIMSCVLVRWLVREVNTRSGVVLLALLVATPMLAVGATLMTIDALSVFFWGMAMVTGWSALQRYSLNRWLLTGVFAGLGFLSKYVAVFQVLSFAIFFAMSPGGRQQLRRAGPWVALAILCLSAAPVIIWNAQHEWITMTHLADRGGLDRPWRFRPNFFVDFVAAEFALLNPVFFVVAVSAAIAAGRRLRGDTLRTYLFCMGAPIFLFYFFYTLRARVQPNWIAPSVVPFLALVAIYLDEKWSQGARWAPRALAAGVAIGLPLIIIMHDTNLVSKIVGTSLPARKDPLVRVRGWKATAAEVEQARADLQKEGVETFVIGAHYGITSLMTFYTPAAKEGAIAGQPNTFFIASPVPLNQFYFWKSYDDRKGQNAIFVRRANDPEPAPEALTRQFRSVTDLGMREIEYRGRVVRKVQLFACRDLL